MYFKCPRLDLALRYFDAPDGATKEEIAEAAAEAIWDIHVDSDEFENGDSYNMAIYDDNKNRLFIAKINVEFKDPVFTANIVEEDEHD